MTYADDVTSVQDSRPVELFRIELPAQAFYLTSHDQDVVYAGITYVATQISAGPTTIATVGRGQVRQIVVTTGIDDAAVQAVLATGPSRAARLTVLALQLRSGEAVQIHGGPILSIELDGIFARLTVPNGADHAMSIQLPFAVASRTCNHALFDAGCQLDRATFKLTPTVSGTPSGSTLVVSSMFGKPDGWATFGEVVRVADGDRRYVRDQTGTTLTLERPFTAIVSGDALEVYPGCDHTVETCRDKFANVTNFGGHPDLPVGNPTAPSKLGVIEQA